MYKENDVRTNKCRDADVLAVVDPHDRGYDFINEALGDAQF